MTIHYKGKYNLDPDTLPHGEHKPNAVAFKEAQDTKKLAIAANAVAFVIIVLLAIPIIFKIKQYPFSPLQLMLGCIMPMLIMFPHELLHAICFKKDVYIYTNFKQGMLFVVGPEDMSKARFIFMSLLPNIIFGFIPYIIWLIFPQLLFMGVFGTLSIGMGAGDYYNVFNAATQMPKGARTYLYKFNSFWYMP